MYDRKKITLFVLLIATVILGGVSLFLATQINQNQSPDDSQAGSGVCSPKYSGVATSCSSQTTQASCIEQSALINANACCQIGGLNNTCNNKESAPSYCSAISCSDRNALNCGEGTIPLAGACNWTAAPAACDTAQACVSGSSRITSAGPNQCKCLCPSGTVVNPGASCTTQVQTTCSATSGDTTCQGRLPGAACQLPGGTNGSCSGTAGNACTCQAAPTGGTNTGGTASCSQNGEIISHGNTACINGTNYTCNNGTATPGSSCNTDPGTNTGGSTGSTCTPVAPEKAKLIAPLKDAVINTATVNLQWQRNGSFGTFCPTNNNKYRVKFMAIALNETCPTSALDIPNLAGQVEPGTSDEGTFNYPVNVQDDMKYCWAIRKNNGGMATDTAVRSFTVNLEETNPTTGGEGGVDGTGTTTSVPIDPTTTSTGGTGAIAGDNTSLPETAIVSDELDPIILGMILVIIGLTLYKFDFGRKTEVE